MPKATSRHYFISLVFLIFIAGCSERADQEETVDVRLEVPVANCFPVAAPVNQVFFGFSGEEFKFVDPCVAPQVDSDATDDEDPQPLDAFNNRGDSLAIMSFDPALPIDQEPGSSTLNPQTIDISDSGLLVSLDTELGLDLEPEFTVYARQNSVFVLNHNTNEFRLLAQFSDDENICEILPYKTVIESGPTATPTLSLVDADRVYVYTSQATCFADDSNLSEVTERFYRVALNYKRGALDGEICVDDGGTNRNENSCFSDDFEPVLESEARAKLVFGWEDDVTTVDATDQSPTWGYLGYGMNEERLRFFDSERNQLWSQARRIESLNPVDLGQSEFSPQSIFELSKLEHDSGDLDNPFGFSYLLQLGRDVFVFDANTLSLFDVASNEVETLFSDRTYKMDARFETGTTNPLLAKLEFVYDSDEVILIDNAKVYRHTYGDSRFTPTVTRQFSIVNADNVFNPPNLRERKPFSQFDLGDCQDEADEGSRNACENAHDVTDSQLPAPGPSWSFIADCSSALGCSIDDYSDDVCVTDAELAIDPSLAALNNACSVLEYQDLDELNQTANDAEFRGFMQYVMDYGRFVEYFLHQDRLLVLARMTERDLLVRYNYDLDPTSLRSEREQVLLGSRFEYQSINVHIDDDDLYIDLLRESAVRNNECYKNYQQVSCLIDDNSSGGLISTCTGLDLANGDCFNEFKEYRSFALFCSEAEISAGTCIDDGTCPGVGACDVVAAPLSNIAVPGTELLSTKWLPLREQTSDGVSTSMKVVASSISETSDEGILLEPGLHNFDATVPSLDLTPITELSGDVESVLDLVSSANGNHLSVVSNEIVQIGGGAANANVSEASQYVILDLTALDQESDPVGTLQFLRPLTGSN